MLLYSFIVFYCAIYLMGCLAKQLSSSSLALYPWSSPVLGKEKWKLFFLTVTIYRKHTEISCHIFNFIYTILIVHNSAICHFLSQCWLSCRVSQKELRILMQKPPSEGIVQYFIALKWKVSLKIKVQENNSDKCNTNTTPKCSGLP